MIVEHQPTHRVKPDMKSRKLLALLILLATPMAGIVAADTNRAAATNEITLVLRYGKAPSLTQDALQPLYSKALEVLESSNFNSRAPRWEWNVSKILEGYRKTVSGNYFLVSFKEPRKLKTVGGEVSVREIIIGLNGRDFASSLHTIDDEGRIVGHAKHSGPLCVEFLKLVKQIAGDS